MQMTQTASGPGRRLRTLCAGLLFANLLAPLATAEQPARTGTFQVDITQKGSWEGFRVAQRHWVWIARRAGVFEGEGILKGLSETCISKGTTAFGISKAEVECRYEDRDGDLIFSSSTEECVCAPGGKGGSGSGKFTAGTGKYVGISGSYKITRKVGARDQGKRTWTDYVTLEGSWTLP